MKPLAYCVILLLIVPVQASLFNPLSLAGIKPDISLAVLYIIGLLTGPLEATIAGMAIGLVQDISSANLIGLAAFSRGLFGLSAGLLGRRVLDIASPSNVVFLTAFSLGESIVIALLMQVLYGSFPFFSLLFTQMLPQALYTGFLGTFMIKFMNSKKIINILRRRSLQKE